MSEPIKVLVGPSAHYHQLKSGPIKYQKSKPASPVWRILVQDEALNKMHIRVFAAQPSADDIEKIIFGVLQGRSMSSVDIVIPATVEKLCPGLQEKLMAEGATVFLPGDGFASGARAGREWEKFISSIEHSLFLMGEAMASCEEVAATSPPSGIITTDLWLARSDDSPMESYHVASHVANQVTRNRGRDPENARNGWGKRLHGAPLNTATKEAPKFDILTELLKNPSHHLGVVANPEMVWDIVQQLKQVRDAGPEEKGELLTYMGATAIINQIKMRPNSRGYVSNFFSCLGFGIKDDSLLYQISLGVKEACNRLVVVDKTLVQFAAAKVLVHYPEKCVDRLKRLPVHDHLQKMIQQISGGRVTVVPDLAPIATAVVSHPISPPFSCYPREIFSPYAYMGSRTPISPAQCFYKSNSGSMECEFLLHVVAILPETTTRYLPLRDKELAARMTGLVNERLARAGKGVLCTIAPLEPLGELMDIGPPPK